MLDRFLWWVNVRKPKSVQTNGTPPSLAKVFSFASSYRVREEFERLVVGDIHGPVFGPDEILPASPIPHDRYLVGMLAPSEVRVQPGQTDDSGNAQDESGGDVSGSDRVASVGFFPSSIGLSFVLDEAVAEIEVRAEWGQYKKETRPAKDLEDLTGFYRSKKDADKNEIRIWRRYPQTGVVNLTVQDGDIAESYPVPEFSSVKIRGRARKYKSCWLVTLFLVNDQTTQKNNADQQWLFQTALTVRHPDGKAIFLERAGLVSPKTDETDGELAHLAMLYRDVVEFTVGHGTAVKVTPDPHDPSRAIRLTTQNVPTFEVPRTEQPDVASISLLAGLELDMSVLATKKGNEISDSLMPIAVAYHDWLNAQEARIAMPAERLGGHEDAARQALTDARVIVKRIEEGIVTLVRDKDAAESFRFANEAMWKQRIQQVAIAHQKSVKADTDADITLEDAVRAVDIPRNRSWRLFQLAFFCLNIPSLTDVKHEDRKDDSALVDLLFFPTGGGKTEAYLGLVAYTFAIRRLQGKLSSDDGDLDGSEGVAVLMRYTLRLLTSQQFQRAAALVCACEYLRRDRIKHDMRWGETPFRLGLWIGSSTTPNWTNDAKEAVESARQRDGYTGGQADPLKLTACPWCGALIDTGRDVHVNSRLWRTITTCSDPYGTCPFTAVQSSGEGIPVVTVDEEIYRLLPSFLIATVDKFAQLPWNGALHLLFGRTYARCTRHGFRSRDLDVVSAHPEKDTHRAVDGLPEAKTIPCGRLRPPDLIIQDELHLISGPLGTLVGLYETAIDILATMNIDGVAIRPKVIASTATIRRAAVQGKALFQRRLSVFPPAVLDTSDNFFAEQTEPSENTPGRRYVGVCARGLRLKAAEARLTISILAAAQAVFEKYGPAADQFMTMVGYFSSLRELAGMRRMIDDDVRQRLSRASLRGLGKRSGLLAMGELTSRMRSDDIPKMLDRLGLPHVPGAKTYTSSGPLDIVLATNMISVGVDVPRLGLMLTVGQPKSTAEYIQATSRVGRDIKMPGVVFTLYNWIRPRDLSHYERFEYDHATFYRQVEALSVTPFSRRAIDRGLTAIVVSLIRHEGAHRSPTGAKTNPESGAQNTPVTDQALRKMLSRIVDRVKKVEADPHIAIEVEKKINDLLDLWADRQRSADRDGALLSYKGRGGATAPLLARPLPYQWNRWNAPNSLRETEHTINLILRPDDVSANEAPNYRLKSLSSTASRSAPSVEDTDEADLEEAALS